MLLLKRSLLLASFSVIFLMLGSTYFTTFVSIRLSHNNISETWIGLVHTGFSVGFVLGTLKAEQAIEKLGHVKSYLLFGLLFAISTVLNKYFDTVYGWMFFRLIDGICLSALYVVLESFYLLISPMHKRGTVLSIYMIALYVSQSVSQFFYNVIPYQSDTTFWVLGLLILISCIPPLFLKNPKIVIPNLSLFSILKTTSFSWLGLNASLISGAILTAIYSFLPLLAKKLGLSISLAMSLMILGGLLCQWPVGALSDRMDRKKLLLWIGCLTLIPCAVPFFFEISKIGYYAIIVSIGVLSFALYPVGMTLVCENKPSEELTGLTELLLLFYSVGMIFGPLLTPVFNKITDPFGLYLEIIAFSSIITAHCVFGLLKKRLSSSSA